MHIAAVAWLNFANGLSFACSFRSALISPAGFRVNAAPLTSASSSRRRDNASRINGPKTNATTLSRAAASRTTSVICSPSRPRGRMKKAHRHTTLATRAAKPISVVTISSSRTS